MKNPGCSPIQAKILWHPQNTHAEVACVALDVKRLYLICTLPASVVAMLTEYTKFLSRIHTPTLIRVIASMPWAASTTPASTWSAELEHLPLDLAPSLQQLTELRQRLIKTFDAPPIGGRSEGLLKMKNAPPVAPSGCTGSALRRGEQARCGSSGSLSLPPEKSSSVCANFCPPGSSSGWAEYKDASSICSSSADELSSPG